LPCPVVIVVNLGVVFILIFNLSSTLGKKSFVVAPFVVFSHSIFVCVCVCACACWCACVCACACVCVCPLREYNTWWSQETLSIYRLDDTKGNCG